MKRKKHNRIEDDSSSSEVNALTEENIDTLKSTPKKSTKRKLRKKDPTPKKLTKKEPTPKKSNKRKLRKMQECIWEQK